MQGFLIGHGDDLVGNKRFSTLTLGRKVRMFLPPIPERSKDRAKVAALLGEKVLGSWRVILVKASLNDPAVLQRLQSG